MRATKLEEKTSCESAPPPPPLEQGGLRKPVRPQGASPLQMQEPELPDVPEGDRMLIRNVLYTIWAVQSSGRQAGDNCVSWQVQTKQDGYLVLVSLSRSFSVCLQDLQLVVDVSPMRVDSVLVRAPENENCQGTVGGVLVVRVLNEKQPVKMTELEVVRVHKRHRGWLSRIL